MLIFTEKISLLEKHLGAFFYGWAFELGELSLNVSAQGVTEALGLLKAHEDLLYAQLLDICAVDYLGRKPVRFEVVYHLLSLVHNERIRVKVSVGENDKVPSVTSLFPGADWWESEAYDMFGIIFEGHPGLRRILTDYDFEGFPLRKDFPLTGYTEVRYDPVQQKVILEPVKLAQAYRSFETLSPWQGISDVLKREDT